MRAALHPGLTLSRVDGEMSRQNDKTNLSALQAKKKGENNGYREITNDNQFESPSDGSLFEGHQGMSSRGNSSEPQRDGEDEQSKTKRMAVGTPVYIRDPLYSWIPATIESEGDKHVKVKVRLPADWEEHTVLPVSRGARDMKLERVAKLADYGKSGELPLQNLEKDGVTVTEKDDIADLANLHMAAILYSLKARHAKSLPYTRVGDIIVAMNPFRWIGGLYSEEKQHFYANNLIWQAHLSPKEKVPMNRHRPVTTMAPEKEAVGNNYEKLGMTPHVYELSSLAYLGLAKDQSDQTIIVTGESGAGKSETIKIVMNHLATLERSRPTWSESDRGVAGGLGSVLVERILQANPLFESFGNAKTLRNDNSSRFGKFTQLLFDVETAAEAEKGGRAVPSCHVAGSKCITYLLEKSRVVSAGEGERTFHIFYQLLGAPDDDKQKIWGGLIGAGTSDFSYLSNTSVDDADDLANGAIWPDTVAALSVFGIHGDVFTNVMRSLCVILQLGNVAFLGELHDGEERAVVSSLSELEKLSSLLGVPKADIETALTRRFITMRGEKMTIFLKVNEARDGCDALAKEIYARVFHLLVKKCNDATQPKAVNAYGNISLLDIFGFENFGVNRFEQFCINYANEKLQQKYVMDNFEAIRLECEEEGVSVFDISLVDNTNVVELLEGKIGLIAQLNDECAMKNGLDENFVRKFKMVNSKSAHIVLDHRYRRYEFGIKHYAAPTKYDARTFIERNLDRIPTELLKCAGLSSNPLIREGFQQLSSKLEAPKPGGGLRRRSEMAKHLVVTKFKEQLTALMSLIEKSRTRYIRCVKPNKQMMPRRLDHSHTVSQLESAGLVTAIVMASESFPNWLSYNMIMERFGFLARKFCGFRLDYRDVKFNAETLLNHLLAGMNANSQRGTVKPFSCGKTRVYFRAGALELIETVRQDHYAGVATRFQAFVRSRRVRRRFLTLKRGMILLQQKVRRWLGHEQHAAMSLRLQRWMRSHWTRQRFLTMKRSAPLLQCQIRRWMVCKSYARTIRRVVLIQCFVRKCFAKKELSRLRRYRVSAVLIQTGWRGKRARGGFKAACQAAIRIQCCHRVKASRKALAALKSGKKGMNATGSRILHKQRAANTQDDVMNEILQWQKRISSRNIASRMTAPRTVAPRKTHRKTAIATSSKRGSSRKPVEEDQRKNREASKSRAKQSHSSPDTMREPTQDAKREQTPMVVAKMAKDHFEPQVPKERNKVDGDRLVEVREISIVNSVGTIGHPRYDTAANSSTKDVLHSMSEITDTSETEDHTAETDSTSQTSTAAVGEPEKVGDLVAGGAESGIKSAAESDIEDKDSHGTSSDPTTHSAIQCSPVAAAESNKFDENEFNGTASGQKFTAESFENEMSKVSLRYETIESERSQLVQPKRPHSPPAKPQDQEVIDIMTGNSCHYYPAVSPLPKLTAPPDSQMLPSRDASDYTARIPDGESQKEASHENSQPARRRGWIKIFVLAIFLILAACGTMLGLVFSDVLGFSSGNDRSENSDAEGPLPAAAVAASMSPSSMPSEMYHHHSTRRPSLRANSSPPTPVPTSNKLIASPNLSPTTPTSDSPVSLISSNIFSTIDSSASSTQQSTLPAEQDAASPQAIFSRPHEVLAEVSCHPIEMYITFGSAPIGTGYELIKTDAANGNRTVDVFFPHDNMLADRPFSRTLCLEEGGYKFKMYDSWGNGLGDGGYVVACDGVVIARNGEFEYSEQTLFEIPYACAHGK